MKPIVDAIDDNPALCNHVHLPVQIRIDAHAGRHAAPLHARRIHAPHRVDEERARARSPSPPISSSVSPARPKQDFEETLALLEEVEYDSIFSFKYSRRPNTSALALDDQIPEEEKTRRLTIVQEHAARDSDPPQRGLSSGTVEECLVEGFNKATGQWIGRTSQHKTLNFLRPGVGGRYCWAATWTFA